MVQGRVPVQKRRVALIAAGANLPSAAGDPGRTILAALAGFDAEMGTIVAISRLFRTPAYPPGAGPDFVNAVFAVETPRQAPEILAHLHEREAAAGRERQSRWGARTLDLDLLALGDEVWPDEVGQRAWAALDPDRQKTEAPGELILPHPRLQDRAFVLIPLADIRPRWRHPVTGAGLADMIAALPEADKAAICPV